MKLFLSYVVNFETTFNGHWNVHKMCFWVNWMMFTRDLKIDLLMSKSFFMNLLHSWAIWLLTSHKCQFTQIFLQLTSCPQWIFLVLTYFYSLCVHNFHCLLHFIYVIVNKVIQVTLVSVLLLMHLFWIYSVNNFTPMSHLVKLSLPHYFTF